MLDRAYYLARAADLAAHRPTFIAARHAAADVMAALGCDERTAALVRVCRLPRAGSREADVAEVARFCRVDAGRLGALLAGEQI